MSKKQAVATVEDHEVAVRPDFMGDGARGNEDVKSDDLTIPRIAIIQDLSPQHKSSKPEYIEGAAPGMAFNTATSRLYGESILTVPVFFRKEYIIWRDIDKGGGFEGAYHSMQEAEQALKQVDNPEECEIVDTAQQFVLILDPVSTVENPVVEQAVVSMSKSQMKPNRAWNTMIASAGGDRFERLYRLSVVEDQNKQGQDFYNYKVEQKGFVSEAIFREAEKFYEVIKSGAMDVSRRSSGTGSEGPAESGTIEEGEEF